MTVKWKLFGLANYIFLLAYIYILSLSFRFIIEIVPGEESLTPFMPMLISQVVIILNSVFNLYIFHIYLPNKSFTGTKVIVHVTSSILYAISFSTVSIYYFIALYNKLKSHPMDNPANLALAIFFIHLLIGIFILVCQFKVRKFIENNYRQTLNNQIEEGVNKYQQF